ncbi:hypothetical protein Hanom_Chr13g01189281 [Helianthus anomalus]
MKITLQNFVHNIKSQGIDTNGMFVFLEKFFFSFYVCATQTTSRRSSLQSVCFLEDISFKKVCLTSSWCRHGPPSSNLFYIFF